MSERKFFMFQDRHQPIPNSTMLRDYCDHCFEPIRITPESIDKKNYCERCDGHGLSPHAENLTPRMKAKLK